MEDNQETDDLGELLQKKVDKLKEMVMDGNIDAAAAGMSSVIACASAAGGELSIAAEVGALVTGAAVTGAAIPLIAVGIGVGTYMAFGGFARYAIRKVVHDAKNGQSQSEDSDGGY
jgi:hypothetical protein